jgi:hypothetical protein
MSELEKDILEFYKWLLLDKKTNNELSYLGFSSIVLMAMKIINEHELDINIIQKQALKLNLTAQYFYLDGIFEISSFRNKYFTLDEIKFRRNRWYVPEIDKLN